MSEVVKFRLGDTAIKAITEDVRRFLAESADGSEGVPGASIHVLIPLRDGRALLGLDERIEDQAFSLEELREKAPSTSVRSFHQLSIVLLEGSHWVLSTSGGVREYKKGIH